MIIQNSKKKYNSLREKQQKIRKSFPIFYQNLVSNIICKKISLLKKYYLSKNIALYWPIKGEINLNPLWLYSLLNKKKCYFPFMKKNKTLSFLQAKSNTPFIKNKYNILEPDCKKSKKIALKKLDIIFIPIVAFDKNCNRLGMGYGYYDRTLSYKKNIPTLIGVAYDTQYIHHINKNHWDISINLIITQYSTYYKIIA
ncbi:5-formyltetrahydrofolate cyclo-ligase [Candidatus Legionella polyplacis]|uniref:5-formyltetrahydrofolate cyclo-ligase n=1 Tax=Candidatus Legionella polyplacis TaxID=2005262 RepID=A0ABZ2GZJ9_9GAMM|nr:5-formyltetrahydrofolate cyclo-ligase [Candidatus Legionella polyplacis]ATW01737.1 5-formyltetrahydrofolate cyclo-ligase [Candidatus Legionella polyplacis]